MRVYLTGFMGAGKTATGLRLAHRRSWRFLDLDRMVEERTGMAVAEIFYRHGESRFRRLEREALEATVDESHAVVATGGGTFTFETNVELIRQIGVSVWLNPSFATIMRRIGALGKRDRPLFKDEQQALALYRERLPAYRRADLCLDVAVGEDSEVVAARIDLWLSQRECVT
jgi:shikimate kinase